MGDYIKGLTNIELDINQTPGFKTSAKFRFGSTYTLGNGAHPTMFSSKERDDAIGLTQFLGADYYRLIPI